VVDAGKAVAFFRHNGNCDEVNAFYAATGARAWARTLDQDGHPVNGNVSLAYTADTIFAYTADVVYAIEVLTGPCTVGGPGCGLSRWNYPADAKCRVDRVVAGTAGALIAETCGQQYRVLLHDPYQEYTDKANTKVAVNWAHTGPAQTMPLAADGLVLVATASGVATSYDPTSGKVRATIRIPGAGPRSAGATVIAGSDTLVWSAGQSSALDTASGRVLWTVRTGALPALDSQGRLFVGSTDGVQTLDPGTGKVDATVAVGRDLTGQRLARVAAGVVVAGSATSAYL
jgi:hypothetical protein